MNMTKLLTDHVAKAIAPILRRAVFPETTFAVNGADVPEKRNLLQHPYMKRMQLHETKKPLAPRDRLSVRLAMLVALSEARKQVMHDIIRDVEAIHDAKQHKTMDLAFEVAAIT